MARKNLIAFEDGEFTDEYFITRSNPRLWKQDGVRNKFQGVFAPSFPEIEQAYQDAGKGVYRDGQLEFKEFFESDVDDYEGDTLNLDSPLSSDDFISSEITDINDTSDIENNMQEEIVEVVQEEGIVQEEENVDVYWREMSWPKMRSFATNFTDEPVKSKDQAIEVLEKAESEGRI